MANKIKYGIKNAYYAVATIGDNNTATYGTPVALPGAVSLSLDQEGENNIFYADNIAYFSAYGNDGYTGSLELALIPDAFRTEVLGEVLDNKGVIVENQNAETVHFALLFQFEGDKHGTRHVLYNCTAARPTVAGKTTTNTKEPDTTALTITAAPMEDGMVKARTTVNTPAEIYNGWFDAVWQPNAAEG